MPPEIRAYLAGLHHDQLVNLHARFDNTWTAAWLATAESALAEGKSTPATRSA
jgi:hypothetical protein